MDADDTSRTPSGIQSMLRKVSCPQANAHDRRLRGRFESTRPTPAVGQHQTVILVKGLPERRHSWPEGLRVQIDSPWRPRPDISLPPVPNIPNVQLGSSCRQLEK
jgi:hypothetical protein